MLERRVVVVSVVVYFCLLGVPSSAQDGPSYPTNHGFFQSAGIVKFFNSFTSYQFPNPFPPSQSPLSRLEFPVDQWFAGGVVSYSASSWTVHGESWINLNKESGLKMQDSDWDDDINLTQKTIFSESKCRLNRGTIVELGCSFATPLDRSIFLRPVVGYRYQFFFFTTHDGFQASLDGDAFELPGDGIEFRQSFEHFYFGGVWNSAFALPLLRELFANARLELKFDYALVRAKNEDLHLLRSGHHMTADTTRGHCWHLAAGLDFLAADALRARVYADFKRILTDGSHRLSNNLFALDFSFDGAHVWSDQASISAEAIVSF
ncbi:MAG: omptin family outer membrane protease [Desulfomonile tiedjei]|uniref:Omptin family outer membrane protease n=1 Tax=Desulfomonile tiedjei TaxID=2358 RepID=A0A9D6V0M7_9BACT|nr:omptin family outer membrane protease [Desulfomonile tiedjei]